MTREPHDHAVLAFAFRAPEKSFWEAGKRRSVRFVGNPETIQKQARRKIEVPTPALS